MTRPAIKVEGLYKEYAVGQARQRHGTFYDLLSHSLQAPLRRLRNLGDLTEARERFWALRDVSFEIQPGEVVGVIGRNGAGKSTLLKILSRITAPTKGKIEVRGRLASLLEVGTGFHPELSGRENIFLNGAILGMSRSEVVRKFDEIVAFAEIGEFIDTPVKRYSSGMYVRLAFAVAANLEPDVLIIDEVLAVGDAQFQKKCLGKLRDVSAQGRTVLFVSHNLSAIEQLTKRAILVNEGSIVSYADTETVVNTYTEMMGAGVPRVMFDVDNSASRGSATCLAHFTGFRFDRNKPVFDCDDDIEFVACLRSTSYVKDMRFSVTIFSSDGAPIGTCFGAPFAEMSCDSEAEFLVKLPHPSLAPGKYFCGVSVGKGDYRNGYIDFDVVLETLAFEIRPPSGDGESLPNWERSWGRIVLSSLSQKLLRVYE